MKNVNTWCGVNFKNRQKSWLMFGMLVVGWFLSSVLKTWCGVSPFPPSSEVGVGWNVFHRLRLWVWVVKNKYSDNDVKWLFHSPENLVWGRYFLTVLQTWCGVNCGVGIFSPSSKLGVGWTVFHRLWLWVWVVNFFFSDNEVKWFFHSPEKLVWGRSFFTVLRTWCGVVEFCLFVCVGWTCLLCWCGWFSFEPIKKLVWDGWMICTVTILFLWGISDCRQNFQG